eukprot:scaffold5.g827.t1
MSGEREEGKAAALSANGGGSAAAGPSSHSMALQSFPVTATSEEMEADSSESGEEVHQDRNVHIKVTQSPGFLCHISASATMPIEANALFKQVITHPDNAAIFRHMDRCTYRQVRAPPRPAAPATPPPPQHGVRGAEVLAALLRRRPPQVLEESGGRRRVEVEHEASWRFLMFHGKFHTRLLVEEDDATRTMHFELKPGTGGIMKRFKGAWQVEPHPDDPEHCSISTLDQASECTHAVCPTSSPVPRQHALSVANDDLALAVSLPPPFNRILKGISCRQVRSIMEDIQKEADRMASGKPSLAPWEQFVEDSQPKFVCCTCQCDVSSERSLVWYTLVDVACRGCSTRLGWRYLTAARPEQRYKEGALLLEQAALQRIAKPEEWEGRPLPLSF